MNSQCFKASVPASKARAATIANARDVRESTDRLRTSRRLAVISTLNLLAVARGMCLLCLKGMNRSELMNALQMKWTVFRFSWLLNDFEVACESLLVHASSSPKDHCP